MHLSLRGENGVRLNALNAIAAIAATANNTTFTNSGSSARMTKSGCLVVTTHMRCERIFSNFNSFLLAFFRKKIFFSPF